MESNRVPAIVWGIVFGLLLVMIPTCIMYQETQETHRLTNPNYVKLKTLQSAEDAKKYMKLRNCFREVDKQ